MLKSLKLYVEMEFGIYKDAPYVTCSMFHIAKIHQHYCAAKIIANPTSIGVLALTYSRLWS
jgi:hypothetical protein